MTPAEVHALVWAWSVPILGYLGFIAVLLLGLAIIREATR